MGWIATLLTFIGLILNAKRIRISWIIWVVGDLFWIVHALQVWDAALFTLNVLFIFVNLYGYKQWKKHA